VSWTAKKPDEWVLQKAWVKRTLLASVKTKNALFGHIMRHNSLEKDIVHASPFLFRGAGHEKKRGQQLKRSLAFALYIESFPCAHAFITSRIDGCNTVLAGSPRTVTDRPQRLLNAATRVVSNTGKFDRGLTHLLHAELHWLDVPQRILHKLGVTVHRCFQGRAPQYTS